MKYRNHQLIADRLSVTLCAGIDPRSGAYCRQGDHEAGWAEPGVVHWRDRRVSRAGLHRFLRLVVRATHRNVQSPDLWRQVYRENVEVARQAARLHVRIPREATLMDRAIVKAALVHVPTDDPERGPAMAWARRR
jgi:hypothetical protein